MLKNFLPCTSQCVRPEALEIEFDSCLSFLKTQNSEGLSKQGKHRDVELLLSSENKVNIHLKSTALCRLPGPTQDQKDACTLQT